MRFSLHYSQENESLFAQEDCNCCHFNNSFIPLCFVIKCGIFVQNLPVVLDPMHYGTGVVCTHLLQRCHRHSSCDRHNDVPFRNVKRNLTEDDGNQVRFDCDEDHVGATDHLQVGMSGVNAELLKAEGGTLPGWTSIQTLARCVRGHTLVNVTQNPVLTWKRPRFRVDGALTWTFEGRTFPEGGNMEVNSSSSSPRSLLSAALLRLTTQDALGDAERHVARTDEANLPLPLHVRVHFDLMTGHKLQVNCDSIPQLLLCIPHKTTHNTQVLEKNTYMRAVSLMH